MCSGAGTALLYSQCDITDCVETTVQGEGTGCGHHGASAHLGCRAGILFARLQDPHGNDAIFGVPGIHRNHVCTCSSVREGEASTWSDGRCYIHGLIFHYRYQESREMIQKMLVFSRKNKNTTVESKEWRMEVAYRTLMMLRTSVAVMEYPSVGTPAWEVPELAGQELEYCTPSQSWRRHAQLPHTQYMDTMRVPSLMAYLLRQSIVSQEERLPHPMVVLHESKLLGSVDSFLQGYYG